MKDEKRKKESEGEVCELAFDVMSAGGGATMFQPGPAAPLVSRVDYIKAHFRLDPSLPILAALSVACVQYFGGEDEAKVYAGMSANEKTNLLLDLLQADQERHADAPPVVSSFEVAREPPSGGGIPLPENPLGM